jgi:hypothetical protein
VRHHGRMTEPNMPAPRLVRIVSVEHRSLQCARSFEEVHRAVIGPVPALKPEVSEILLQGEKDEVAIARRKWPSLWLSTHPLRLHRGLCEELAQMVTLLVPRAMTLAGSSSGTPACPSWRRCARCSRELCLTAVGRCRATDPVALRRVRQDRLPADGGDRNTVPTPAPRDHC